MAGSLFIRCHVLDPRLGEFFGPGVAQGVQIIAWRWFCILAVGEPRPTRAPIDRHRDRRVPLLCFGPGVSTSSPAGVSLNNRQRPSHPGYILGGAGQFVWIGTATGSPKLNQG